MFINEGPALIIKNVLIKPKFWFKKKSAEPIICTFTNLL